jgi:hypothetical protein
MAAPWTDACISKACLTGEAGRGDHDTVEEEHEDAL